MSTWCRIFLILFFLLGVIYPLICLFFSMDGEDFRQVLSSHSFSGALINSLLVGLGSTVLSIAIAFVLAWCVERTSIRLKRLWILLFTIPMLIPSISHGIGLIVLLGNNGMLTRFFNLSWNIYGPLKRLWILLFTIPMLIPSISHGIGLIVLLGNNGMLTRFFNLSWNIYGPLGIIVGSTMYSFPVAFIMLSDVLRYEDRTPYEAAEVMGINKFHQFWAITAPFLRKPMISVFFAVFTMIFTDYGVPLVVGGKFLTLPVLMYQDVIGQMKFGRGAVYAIFLLLPAVISFLFDLFNKDSANSSFVTKTDQASSRKSTRTVSYLICLLAAVLIVLPIMAFCILGLSKSYPDNLAFSTRSIEQTFTAGVGGYLINSIEIAAAVALIGTVVAFFTAYLTTRMKTPSSRILHLVSITSATIPGIVLGLSYIFAFKSSFIYGTLLILILVNTMHFFASPYLMIYNSLGKINSSLEDVGATLGISRKRMITLLILILVNTMHFFASPYLMIYNSLGKINSSLEDVGATLGISRKRMIWDILIPQSKSTLLGMAVYFFVNSMMTISAVSFLATNATKPIALMINQFESLIPQSKSTLLGMAVYFFVNSMMTISAVSFLATNATKPIALMINQFESQSQLECAAIVSMIILLINLIVKLAVLFLNRASAKRSSRAV